MTKEQLKAYICEQIESMDESDVGSFAHFLQGEGEAQQVAEELVVIKGEFKKLTKLVQTMEEKIVEASTERTKEELQPFITFYSFLQNSKDAMDSLPEASLFGLSKFNKSFGAFQNGFVSMDILYQDIMESIGLRQGAQIGDLFDADIHEAVEVTEDENLEDGVIVEILEDGFLYHDQLINYTKVKVNRWI